MLFFLSFYSVVTISVHMMLERFYLSKQPETSGQKFLIKYLVLVFGIFLLFCLSYIFIHWQAIHEYFMSLFLLLVISFGGLIYSYFHIYNMSQTSSRVYILISIFLGSYKTEACFSHEKSTRRLLQNRLSRLEQISQIRIENGSVYINSRSLLWIGSVLSIFRKILKGSNKNI